MSSEIPKNYEPAAVQEKVYRRWLEAGSFAAQPDSRDDRYVIMMPLPNVTGALHMGHAMDNVMQDLLVRWHRMLGDNTLWMPGTDHAGIATQAIVEKFLFETEGKTRHDIGQEALTERIWSWKESQEKLIMRQQQKMGCSCDWDRHRFTLDSVCRAAVREAFFRLFEDGLIYRGDRLVNWDSHLKTAVSDDEIYYEMVQSKFWHLRYPVIDPQRGEPEAVVVATTRPETMLGDTAVACHPDPAAALESRIGELEEKLGEAAERRRPELEAELARLRARVDEDLPRLLQFRDMARAGRKVRLPLVDREIPMIEDVWAKPELGTGCVKITPAHDQNDYEVWQRHRDEIGIINVLAADGSLNENAGAYTGLTVEAGRERVVADLEALGLMGPIEDREMEVGHSDRSKTPIEPYLSRQWFVQMGDVEGGVLLGRGTGREFRSAGLAQAALDAVDPEWRSPTGRNLSFHPDAKSYGNIYKNWLSEKRDWCISRQLWWGHRIPIWHNPLDLDRLEELLTRLAWPTSDEVCVWLGAPDGRQLAPDEVRGLGAEDLAGFEVQVCLRSPEAEERHGETLADFGLERDPDVLDTWFSSALWPHSTLGWPDPSILDPDAAASDRPDILSYYYPGSCLVTGRDIITLWVARMVIAGLYNLGDVPFTDCFVHATILDGKGVTMSKSKGNGVDPSAIIERYGADGMRYLICHMQTGAHYAKLPVQAVCPNYDESSHGSEMIDLGKASHGRTKQGGENLFTYLCPECDVEFDVSGTLQGLPRAKVISASFEMGRNFCTKLWSATRFALMNLGGYEFRPLTAGDLADEDRWILSRLSRATEEVTHYLSVYNPSAALNAARDFFWDQFCDRYLELIKQRVQEDGSSSPALQVTSAVLDQVLRLLHPFLPFVTEELWQRLAEQAPERGIATPQPPSELLVDASWPTADLAWRDEDLEGDFELAYDVIRGIRDLRAKHRVANRKRVDAAIKAPAGPTARLARHRSHLASQAGLASLEIGPEQERPQLATTQVVGEIEIYVSGLLDVEAEIRRLGAQVDELGSRIAGTEARLANPGFVNKAPAKVVESERAKLASLRDELELVAARLEEVKS